MQGTIHRLIIEKEYGFIRVDKKDYFFHKSALKNVKFDELHQGMEVEFEGVETDKGLRAEDIFV